jgi:transposase
MDAMREVCGKHQLEWFRRQLFGQKSEKRVLPRTRRRCTWASCRFPTRSPTPRQDRWPATPVVRPRTDFAQSKDESALFFDEARVPVETITVANPEVEGLTPTSTR